MSSTFRTIMGFASMVETATGLALMLVPAIVVGLLLGASPPSEGLALARFLGIALLALGVACWPNGAQTPARAPVVWGMLLYNVLVAMFLSAMSVFQQAGGILLWPAAVLHGVIAVLLLWQMNRVRHLA